MHARFVVQRHEQSDGVHWDLMFQRGDALATWRSPCPLADVGDSPVVVERIGDHRLAYLDYEGPVSGDRGTVRIAQRGYFELLRDEPDDWLIAAHSRAAVPDAMIRGVYRLWRAGDQWCIARAALA